MPCAGAALDPPLWKIAITNILSLSLSHTHTRTHVRTHLLKFFQISFDTYEYLRPTVSLRPAGTPPPPPPPSSSPPQTTIHGNPSLPMHPTPTTANKEVPGLFDQEVTVPSYHGGISAAAPLQIKLATQSRLNLLHRVSRFSNRPLMCANMSIPPLPTPPPPPPPPSSRPHF